MTRILVTGAGGLIGARVAAMAAMAGHEVIRLARHGPADVVHDLRRPMPALPDCDAVFHLAGAYVGGSYRRLARADLAMARNLIDWGMRNGIRHWLFASAAEVYGRLDGPGTEQSLIAPVIPYGRIKAQIESRFAATAARRVVCLRIGEVYGPRSKLIGELTARLAAGFCPWPGSGRIVASFVHVDDVAAAFLCALDRAPDGVSTYNVADAEPTTWRAFLTELTRLAGTRPPAFLPVALARGYAAVARYTAAFTGREAVMTPNVVTLLTTPKALSIGRIVQELGYAPRYPDIRAGLETCFGLSHDTQNGGTQRAAARSSA